ncbi:MAG: ankyrin repeat domain-containing protein, partial [Chlamydiia bacterium]|nr:ankyrin repeat domain-containing protein [Chlamydiia bacterium]
MKIDLGSLNSTQAPLTTHTYSLILEAIELKRFKDAIFLVASLSSAELSQLDFWGWNLLHRAVKSGDVGLVEATLNTMDPEAIAIRNKQGLSALEMAIKRNLADCTTAIASHLDSAQLTCYNSDGDTPLHLAAKLGKTDAAIALMKHLEIEAIEAAQAKDGSTALILAARGRHWGTVRALAEQMTPEGIGRAVKNHTALTLALHDKDSDAACTLAAKMHGADLLQLFPYLSTPLDMAVLHRMPEVGEVIIKQLMEYCSYQPPTCPLRYHLLRAAVKLELRDLSGVLISSISSEPYHPGRDLSADELKFSTFALLELKDSVNSNVPKLSALHATLLDTIIHGWTEEALAILDRLPDEALIWDKVASGPLHHVGRFGGVEIAEALLKRIPPSQILARNSRGRNILHEAALCGKDTICQLIIPLISKDSLTSWDGLGRSALHLACDQSYENVCLLVEAMAPEDLS